MNRKLQIFTAGAGAAGLYFFVTLFRKKRPRGLRYGRGIKIKRTVSVARPAGELYSFWRNLAGLPVLVDDLLSVAVRDTDRSHWVLRVPGGLHVEWDAEITVDRPNEMIGWRSLDGSQLDNAGYIRFKAAPGGGETNVTVALQYNPQAGKLGAALASLAGKSPAREVEEALRRFKAIMEAAVAAEPSEQRTTGGPVDIASEDSFPASDAPAWTGTVGPL